MLDEAQRAEVETLAAVLTAQQIADYFGIARRTFWDLMARDEDVAARYKRGRARAIGSIAQSLITKARGGNVTAMIFFLKTQGGWRETVTVETAEEPQSVPIDMSRLSDAALIELAAAAGLDEPGPASVPDLSGDTGSPTRRPLALDGA